MILLADSCSIEPSQKNMPPPPCVCSTKLHQACRVLTSLGPLVLALYEYIITFDREVQNIWKRKLSFVTLLWVMVSARPDTYYNDCC